MKTFTQSIKPKVRPLTDVEICILNYILEMRYMSFEQLTLKFPLANLKEVLSNLIKQELLATKAEVLEKDSLIKATAKAQETIKTMYPNKKVPEYLKSIFQPRIKHDLLLNDLRIRFEELKFIKKWVSEAQLKELPVFLRAFTNMPDAICIKNNDKGYFLELEVSQKGPKQYLERIEEYQKILKNEDIKNAGIEGVIFFCLYEEVQEKIKELVPKGTKEISVLSYKKYFKQHRSKFTPIIQRAELRQEISHA